MIRTLAVILTAVCFSFTLAAPLAAADSFEIVGSGTPQNLLRMAAEAFNAANADIEVSIPNSIGSGGGYKAVGRGEAVLGRVARPPKDKEKPFGLTHLVFAKGPSVIMAHPGVEITNLTAEQSVKLFSGEITNWKDIGGPDLKVRVVARQPGETNLSMLQKKVPGWADLVVTDKSKLAASDQEMSADVAGNEGAVGFGPYDEAVTNGLISFSIDGVAPDSPEYGVTGTMAFIYKEGNLTDSMKKFIDFIFSAEGGDIIKKSNAIPVPKP
jgi:phosphate transport system substrate-binding protein